MSDSNVAHRSPFSEAPVAPEGEVKPFNRQLYQNGYDQDPTAWMYAESDLRLHNDRPPNLGIVHEKPEHRVIVYMKAQGLSNTEVAERTGYGIAWVGQICRQPWFRLQLVNELREAGVDQIHSVLKASALDSVWTLIDIRDDKEAPKAVRKACSDSLLDRYLGKATQRIESDNVPPPPANSELGKLDAEIKRLESQLNDGRPTESDT